MLNNTYLAPKNESDHKTCRKEKPQVSSMPISAFILYDFTVYYKLSISVFANVGNVQKNLRQKG